jgi:uncharacterized membrane protein
MESEILVFKQGRVWEIISIVVLSLAALVLTIYQILLFKTGSVEKILYGETLVIGICIPVVVTLIKRVKNKKYQFVIKGNVIEESIDEEITNTIVFSKILGIKNLARYKTDPPKVSIYGTKDDGSSFSFEPTYTPGLTDMFLKLKKRYPDLVIDERFSRHVEFYRHKKIFGSYDPYQIFLFIILVIGIFGVPLLIILATI